MKNPPEVLVIEKANPGHEETFGDDGMLVIMIVEMVSWAYPYVKIYQIKYFKYV